MHDGSLSQIGSRVDDVSSLVKEILEMRYGAPHYLVLYISIFHVAYAVIEWSVAPSLYAWGKPYVGSEA